MRRLSQIAAVFLFLLAGWIVPVHAAEITFTNLGSQIMLTWPGTNSPAWRLQYATDLSSSNWTEMDNFTVTNGIYSVIESGTNTWRFYRLYQEPASQDQPPVPVVVDQDGTSITLPLTPYIEEGSIDNYFDASQSTDPRGGTLAYHWVLSTPNSVQYSSQGVMGYYDPQFSFEADSIPNFGQQSITFTLTLTHEPFDPYATTPQSTNFSFKVSYRDSALTLSMSTTCQTLTNVGPGCNFAAGLKSLETP